jgi:oligopeptide transport system substrate-binding protein
VTANDFVYAWQRAVIPPPLEHAWYIELMKVAGAAEIIAGEAAPDTLGVRAVDDHTLEVTLTSPLPYFPQMVTHTTTFPMPAAGRRGAWRPVDPARQHVGQRRLRAERARAAGAHPARAATLSTGTCQHDHRGGGLLRHHGRNQALTRWESGEMQMVPTPAGQYPTLLETYPDETFRLAAACTYYYHVNLREDANPALLDANVRQALNLAIDRQVIAESILAGGRAGLHADPLDRAGWEVPSVPAGRDDPGGAQRRGAAPDAGSGLRHGWRAADA